MKLYTLLKVEYNQKIWVFGPTKIRTISNPPGSHAKPVWLSRSQGHWYCWLQYTCLLNSMFGALVPATVMMRATPSSEQGWHAHWTTAGGGQVIGLYAGRVWAPLRVLAEAGSTGSSPIIVGLDWRGHTKRGQVYVSYGQGSVVC